MTTQRKTPPVRQQNIVHAISQNFSLCSRCPLPKSEVQKIYQTMDAEKKKKQMQY